MQHKEIEIETADGLCPTHVYHPDGRGPWPGVIVYMDGVGIRPAMMEIAEHIASAGYYVLLPNVFYRTPDFDPSQGLKLFSDPEYRKDLMTRVMPTANRDNVMRDAEALLAHLDSAPEVRDGKIGVTGYCMGGRLAMHAAGTFGDRVVAAASYHASGLATDAPDSPHRRAANMKGRVYVAGAKEDAGFDDAQKARLDAALTDAGVDHKIETYNARHGFVPRDTPVHDEAATKRHWDTLLPLLAHTLQKES